MDNPAAPCIAPLLVYSLIGMVDARYGTQTSRREYWREEMANAEPGPSDVREYPQCRLT